ncbi:4-hydroxythreonine-4-phosphate dehydrogenase PdxA [Azohydromonas aeria]|uniref:4-hydroxythreonine-4-phosphate dehydrogenase PdxA n=1 Tax=Azohydromonas aeria TaxID=2590212 RepID=UPI001E379778|nr:4-hydroxythreonine-4-phosphate dehydrogenase PdxA [Azohydromonas aeria]
MPIDDTREQQPLLVTMGDAAGIGPEIVLRALMREDAPAALVLGCPQALRRAAALLAPGSAWPIAVLESPADFAACPPRCIPVWAPPGLPGGLEALPWGQIDERAGRAAAACIEAAVRLLQAGTGRAIVTAPIHKEALSAAGVPYPGHTEMLQALAAPAGGAAPPVRMMLANEELRVVLVTIHMALRRALEVLDFDAVLSTIRIAHGAAAAWGQAAPRIAVAGLNPHAGEGGLFGDEEVRFIAPAVQAARAEGIDARGPYAPDTVFMRARHAPPRHPGEFDLVVAMTHDHGLIPVKYLGVEEGVNVTLGLPFVRTSPDHGTAFDIAGRGVADDASLRAALRMALALSAGG